MLAPQPFFSPRGTPFSVYYRTLVLTELGYPVDILTYGQGEDVDLPGVRIMRTPGLRWLGQIKTGPSGLKIIHDLFMVLYFFGLQLKHRYPIVHAHEEAVFFATLFKPLLRYKLIYDMHSSLPEQLSNFNFTTSKLLIGAFERLELWSLKAADAVITICPALAAQVAEIAPWALAKHRLIENSIFESVRLQNASSNDTPAAELDLHLQDQGERKLIVYAGTLEHYQGIDILLEAAQLLAGKRQDFLLIIAGGRPEQVAHYQQLLPAASAHWIRLIGQISPDAARALTLKADVILSPRSSGNNTPLKTYEQLASGVPLVATRIYSHTQVLSDEMCVLTELDGASFSAGIEALLDDAALGERLGKCAQQHYEQHYSKPVYTQKLAEILDMLN